MVFSLNCSIWTVPSLRVFQPISVTFVPSYLWGCSFHGALVLYVTSTSPWYLLDGFHLLFVSGNILTCWPVCSECHAISELVKFIPGFFH
ncbi:hypothetical protein [Mycoplasma capricolum]|uniref:hypothetical protein n=1 Tax=Mycoplasma capricolum TaxID=2095 RepID=UPI0022F3FED8|nr:hypothetical protein [Mycoplasma capricolum]WBX36096.1 hypothetical protein NO343_04015 [Mycoplasma capricolum subsp. capricolum]